MMVMVVMMLGRLNSATPLVTWFINALQFQGRVPDAVFTKFFPHAFFDRVRITVCHDMHGGIVAVAV